MSLIVKFKAISREQEDYCMNMVQQHCTYSQMLSFKIKFSFKIFFAWQEMN